MKIIFIFGLLLSYHVTGAQCLSGNCQDGIGTSLISKDVIYTGSFKNNLPDGKGEFKNADLIIYSGEVRMGHYNGTGTQYLDNGDVYIGEFLNGMRHGPGEYRSKKGIEKRKYVYNTLNGRWPDGTAPDGSLNNPIYTGYEDLRYVVLSSGKVAVYGTDGNNSRIDIYDAATGQKLQTGLKLNFYDEPNVTFLYLDFGDKFFDTATQHSKLYYASYFKKSSPTYLGKSSKGEAIFSSYNSSKEIYKLFTMSSAEDKPHYFYTYKGGQYETVSAITADLSKAVIKARLVDLSDEKATPLLLQGITDMYNTRAVFNTSGDSLFINTGGETIIYASNTGTVIGKVQFAGLISVSNFYFSDDPHKLVRIHNYSGGLVFIEDLYNKNDIMPLIDNERTSYAYTLYVQNWLDKHIEDREFQELQHAAYVKKMKARYGEDYDKPTTINANTNKSTTTRTNAPNEVKCTFCNGSGVTANYVTGQEITQDKTSGRWYHVNLAKTGTCPLCHGTGYIKR